jgi:hypothetical protein
MTKILLETTEEKFSECEDKEEIKKEIDREKNIFARFVGKKIAIEYMTSHANGKKIGFISVLSGKVFIFFDESEYKRPRKKAGFCFLTLGRIHGMRATLTVTSIEEIED